MRELKRKDKKVKCVIIRMSEKDKARVEEMASLHGVNMSEFVRLLLIDHKRGCDFDFRLNAILKKMEAYLGPEVLK